MISDEIRELIDDEDLYPRHIAELRRFADRIDAEYLEDGRKAEVSRIILGQKKTSIDLWMCDKGSFFFSVAQRDITHTVPDSWGRIARDLEDWAEGNISGSAQSFAGRIRRLAATKED